MSEASAEQEAIGPRWLVAAATLMAYVGGAILMLVLVVSFSSIVGRVFFLRPVLGDFEIVERATAISVAWFMPYCQLTRGHVIVDFFKRNLPGPRRAILDFLTTALVLITVVLVTWRTFVGWLDLYASGEVSMNLGVPTFVAVGLMLPGFVLFIAACLATMAQHWQEVRQ